MHCRIEAVSAADVNELVRLYIAYRVFYREAPEQERAAAFIRDRVTQIVCCRDRLRMRGKVAREGTTE